jgi:hypothetical protein
MFKSSFREVAKVCNELNLMKFDIILLIKQPLNLKNILLNLTAFKYFVWFLK